MREPHGAGTLSDRNGDDSGWPEASGAIVSGLAVDQGWQRQAGAVVVVVQQQQEQSSAVVTAAAAVTVQ